MIKTEKIRLKIGDYLILLMVLIILLVVLLMIARNRQGNQIHVTANGITTTYSLSGEQRIPIADDKSDSSTEADAIIKNTIVINDGQVYMENADCPDQVCVKHRPISKNGEMIICLPNEVFVEVENDMDNEIDN